jgi:acyl carrier protein
MTDLHSDKEIRAGIVAALETVAPEVEASALRDDLPLRDQTDLDSMDWLNFMLGLHRKFGIDIPEVDYKYLGSLSDAIRYVRQHR